MARNKRHRDAPDVLYDNPASAARVSAALTSFGELVDSTESPEAAERLLADRVETLVKTLCETLYLYEAADMVEVVRRLEMPESLDDYRETEFEGLAAVIEVVAMLTPATLDKSPGSGPPIGPDTARRVADLARELVDDALWIRQLWELRAEPHPLTRLAYRLAEQALLVRAMQYDHIRRQLFESLFMHPIVKPISTRLLGFTWSELAAVYDGALQTLADKANAVLDDLRARNGMDEGHGTSDAALAVEADFQYFMAKPGSVFTVSLTEMVAQLGLPKEVVAGAMSAISYEAGSVDANAAVARMISGKSPMSGKSFLALPGERFVLVHPAAALDGLRQTIESEFKKEPAGWAAYERVRARYAESKALEVLERALTVPPEAKNFKYRITGPGESVEDLGSESTSRAALFAEADGIFVAENVAIVVEVKAGGLTPPARAGYADRLAADLQKTLGDAAAQARRVRDLILTNHGLWAKDGRWWDLKQVTVVHTIVVSLEDFGGAGIAMGELAEASLVPDGDFPWVVSLHDLEAIAELFERPAELLLYLRRRTTPEIARLFRTSDELDLVVLFLRGQLYALPSPDLLAAQDPSGRPPTSRAQRAYRHQRPVLVQSHTDALDAWIYYKYGHSQTPALKPELRANPRLLELVDWLADGHKPGWFGFAPDLLDGSNGMQAGIVSFVEETIRRSREDGASHSAAQGVNGQWGYSLLIAMTRANHEPRDEANQRLLTYASLKKYQTRSSRALALLIGPGLAGPEFEAVGFLTEPWEQDASMDLYVEESGLVPTKLPRVPPSARRASKQLRGKRTKR